MMGMDDSEQRSGRLGALIVALVIGGSAIGVLGWHMSVNRRGPGLDMSGFDLKNVDAARPAAAAATAPTPQPQSGLMVQSDAGVRILDADGNAGTGLPNAKPTGSAGAAGVKGDKKAEARANLAATVRKNESVVRRFAQRMTAKYPSVRQYGKDWAKYPDLNKLDHDYSRNHDPIAFMVGLSRSQNFGKIVSKYALDPGIRAFVIDGMKQAPGELLNAAGAALQNDSLLNSIASNVTKSMGLPPSLTAAFFSGGDATKVDQKKIVSDVINTPMQKAVQQAPPAAAPEQEQPQEPQ